MSAAGEDHVVAADTNVLIQLIQVGQLDMLGALDGFRFVIPGEVLAELIRPESREPVQAALDAGTLAVDSPEDVQELTLLEELVVSAGIGRGEAACLTLAESRGWLVATDDEGRLFVREAEARIGAERVISTPDLILLAIRRGLLPVEDADRFPATWEGNDYAVEFRSFSELLDPGSGR